MEMSDECKVCKNRDKCTRDKYKESQFYCPDFQHIKDDEEKEKMERLAEEREKDKKSVLISGV